MIKNILQFAFGLSRLFMRMVSSLQSIAGVLLLLSGIFLHTTANAAFTVDKDKGTVFDSVTGLTWKICPEGQEWNKSACINSATKLNWFQAASATCTQNCGTITDWRLPTLDQLKTIIDPLRTNPAIDTTVFPKTTELLFWSSTVPTDQSFANYVNFEFGNSSFLTKSNFLQARLVSDGKGIPTTTTTTTTSTAGNVTTTTVGTTSTSTQTSAIAFNKGWSLLGNSLNQAIIIDSSTVLKDQSLVTTVWKWDRAASNWQFFTPSMSASLLQDFATSKGYSVLSRIEPGEGFWLNASNASTIAHSGASFVLKAENILPGWNLLSTSEIISPASFNRGLNPTPPDLSTVPLNFNSLWSWDNTKSQWYFYAPSLDDLNKQLDEYNKSKGYLSFSGADENIKRNSGFWLNKATDTSGQSFSAKLQIVLTDMLGNVVTNLASTPTNTAKVTVTNSSGKVVPDVVVTLGASAPFASITPAATVVTNSNGVASFVFAPASVVGTGTITASAKIDNKDETGTKIYTLSNVTVPTLSLGMMATDLVGNALTTVTATVKDASGAFVPNAIVTFSTLGTTTTTISPTTGTALTNASGQATITIQPSNILGAGSVTAKSKVGTTDVEDIKNYRVTQVAVNPSIVLSLTAGGSTVSTLSNSVTTTLSATVKDASLQPVAGATVTFSTAIGQMSSTTALTNASGVASITLSPGAAAGAGAVTANTIVGVLPLSTSINYSSPVAVVPTITLALTNGIGGIAVTDISSIASTTVTATLRDAAGAGVANAVVSFAASSSATVSAVSALTDANGIARITLSSGTSTGAGTLTASGKVGASDVTGSISYVSADATGLTLALVDGVTPVSAITSTTPVTAKATLKNALGQPVAGVVVTFKVASEAMANLSPGSGTALTDALGVASVTLSAGSAAGATTITATGKVGVREVTSTTGFSVVPAAEPASMTLALADSLGAAATVLSSTSPTTVKATVKNVSGAVIPGIVVEFTTNAAIGKITPTAATALTDSNGVATVSMSPVSLTASGAANITATAGSVSKSVGYSVGAAVVTVATPVFKDPVSNATVTSVSAFGTVSVTANVLSNGVAVAVPQTVTFSSPCASSIPAKAILTANAVTVNGLATASYRDNGCGATDPITASVSGVASASASLSVTAPSIGSIQFVSATPGNITLKGTGGTGRQESAQVIFKVVDNAGNPLGGKTVTFKLSTEVGGITFSNGSTSATATSDLTQGATLGYALVTVNSGTVSTPVRVIASTTEGAVTLTTLSDNLSITTGIPDQDSFSLSVSTFNIEGLNFDGTAATVTARMADHFNNPVPNGTTVNFTTSGGRIDGSCVTTDGDCTATIKSQSPRPDNGRLTVMAYAVGEESFTDLNGNGLADKVATTPATANELIDVNGASTDLGEAFVDYNLDGSRDAATEPFVDFNRDGAYNGPDTKFNGVLCNENNGIVPKSSSTGTCSAQKSLHVFKQFTMVFSGSDAIINNNTPLPTITFATACAAASNVPLTIKDVNGNHMPAGTTIVITTTNGKVAPSSFTVANTSALAGNNNYDFSIQGDGSGSPCVDSTPSGILTITVTTPKGVVTTRTANVIN